MKRKSLFFLLSLLLFLFQNYILITKSVVLAAEGDCGWMFTDHAGNTLNSPFPSDLSKLNYNVEVKDTSVSYTTKSCLGGLSACSNIETGKYPANGRLSGTINLSKGNYFEILNKRIEIHREGGFIDNPYCTFNLKWGHYPTAPPIRNAECTLSLSPSGNITEYTQLIISGEINNEQGMTKDEYNIWCGDGLSKPRCPIKITGPISTEILPDVDNDQKKITFDLQKGWTQGNYVAEATIALSPKAAFATTVYINCGLSFNVPSGVIPTSTITPAPTLSALCAQCYNQTSCSGECNTCPHCPGYQQSIPELKPLCEQLDSQFQKDCKNCINNLEDGGHIWTAIGCLPVNFTTLIKDVIFKTGISIAGGVAFLYFLYGAFLILTSAGNPEKIEEAKQIITSALSGLLLIIFSVFLLKIIGVDILRLPGFGN